MDKIVPHCWDIEPPEHLFVCFFHLLGAVSEKKDQEVQIHQLKEKRKFFFLNCLQISVDLSDIITSLEYNYLQSGSVTPSGSGGGGCVCVHVMMSCWCDCRADSFVIRKQECLMLMLIIAFQGRREAEAGLRTYSKTEFKSLISL